MSCTKTQYQTYEAAMEDVALIQAKSDRLIVPTGAYHCKKCNFYHITSKPTKEFVKSLKRKVYEQGQKILELEKELNILKHQPLPKDERIKIRKDERMSQLHDKNIALNKENKKLKEENLQVIMERNKLKKELDEIKKGDLR